MNVAPIPGMVETEFGNCDTCEEPIRRRGRYGQWVHVLNNNAVSEVVVRHRAEPKR